MAAQDHEDRVGTPPRSPTDLINSSDNHAGPSRSNSQIELTIPQPRPHSPETTLTLATPPRPSTPHLDLASFPTPTLLRLLASLLQQIATANDLLRPDPEDGGSVGLGAGGGGDDQSSSSRSGSRQSSHAPTNHRPHSPLFADSPTAELNLATPNSQKTIPISSLSSTPQSPQRMFTASLASLSHPSSLLSFHARHVPSISIEAYLLRILKYCPTTNEVFLGLLVYFDRMSKLGTVGGVGGLNTVVGNSNGGRGFAIDSFNVHRLVIAGVTVASKFFSDVFYTNSRYAKVGGLPPHELNQLELQFLLLNDFRLRIPLDEMQRYGDRLLGYWENKEEESVEELEPPAVESGGSVVTQPTPAPVPAPAPAPPLARPDEEEVVVTNPSVSESMDVEDPTSNPSRVERGRTSLASTSTSTSTLTPTGERDGKGDRDDLNNSHPRNGPRLSSPMKE